MAQVGLSQVNLIHPWLNSLRGVAFSVSALYVQIHTNIPGSAGTVSISAGDNTRKLVTFAAAASNAIALSGTLPIFTNGGTSETITHVSFWDAPTVGNFRWSSALGSAKPWSVGDQITLTSAGLALGPQALS